MSAAPSPPQPLPAPFADAREFVDAFARDCGGLVSYFDAEERIQFTTQALAAWLGSTPERVVGRTLRELHGEAVQYERAARHADGRSLWISVNLRPHRDRAGLGERIRHGFGSPFEYRGAEVNCGASVGVSLYPDHARDPAALLESADEAMYRVKHSG